MYWKLFDGKKEEWNKKILESKVNYRQLYNWGEYKSLMSWQVLRLKKISKNGQIHIVQITYRKIFSFCAAYIPGNISGDTYLLDKDFKKALMRFTNSKFIYIRLDSNSKNFMEERSVLKKNGWKKPIQSLHNSRSIDCEIDNIENTISNCNSKSWKRNYLKSVKIYNQKNLNIEITNEPNFNDLVSISSQMGLNKKIINIHSIDEFSNLSKSMPNHVIYAIAYGPNQEPLAYRGMIYLDNKAWDFGAASTQKGRDLLVSYFLKIQLFKKARELGVTIYNLGGADSKRYPGVYSFKKGIASHEFTYTGEWEWSNVFFFRLLINPIIFLILSEKIRKYFKFINNYKF